MPDHRIERAFALRIGRELRKTFFGLRGDANALVFEPGIVGIEGSLIILQKGIQDVHNAEGIGRREIIRIPSFGETKAHVIDGSGDLGFHVAEFLDQEGIV